MHAAGDTYLSTYMRETAHFPTNIIFEIIYTFSQNKSEKSHFRMLI